MAKKELSLEQQAELYAKWDRGSFDTVEESVSYHFVKHGQGMTLWEYLREAAEFNRDGAQRIERPDSIRYWHKSGEFLIEKAGKILSYGPPSR